MLKLGEVCQLPSEGKAKLTAPGIPRRSPIQVLTRPDPAQLPRSDEIGRAQGGMAVSEYNAQMLAIYRRHTGGVFLKDFKKQGCHACVLQESN